jgi:Protein of unknown function (DUF3089)
MIKFAISLFALIGTLTACSDGNNELDPDNPFGFFSSSIYSQTDNWLCHPGLTAEENLCASNLDATVVFPDGSTTIEPHTIAADPAVDCFYVYPTVSADLSGNSDLIANEEEEFTVLNQAARYSSFCRVFAPIYRQVTVTVIVTDEEGDGELAYNDVLDSFKHYIANHNNGRGFILIGHSQGAGHLRRLIAEAVEPDEYLSNHMIAAHILGSSTRTMEGTNIVSDTQSLELCLSADQTGCMVSYVTYREGDAFVADGSGRFGRPQPGEVPACTNPSALSGGRASLTPYFPIASAPLLGEFIIDRADGPFADSSTAPEITTPFYTMPGFLEGECTTGPSGIGYLRVSVNADPEDPRADDFNGEMILQDWGLHLVDMTVAMGNLVELGAVQSATWLEK